jgi:hypothetical protein
MLNFRQQLIIEDQKLFKQKVFLIAIVSKDQESLFNKKACKIYMLVRMIIKEQLGQ